MRTKKIEHTLLLLLFLTCCFIVYLYGFLIKSNGDNVEHIHTSWLIWQNNIPYRDFFQHHNPLLWYLFSPIVAVLIDNIKIFSVFNTISMVIFIFVVFFEAKILLQDKLNKIPVLIFSIITLSSFSVLCSMDYRPDTLMYMFFFMGIYYLFKYNNKNSLKDIVLSFLSFFLSFMCSQKILLNLAVIGIIIVYELLTGKIKKQDFYFGLILPIILFILFLSYLHINNALAVYIKSNYYFNLFIPTIFGDNRTSLPPFIYYDLFIFVPLGLCGAIYLFLKGTDIEKFLSILFLEEFILRVFYFSAFLHYNLLLLLLGIMLSVIFLYKTIQKPKLLLIISIIYIFFALFYNYKQTYLVEISKKDTQANYEYVFNNTTPCDYVINGYYAVYNLKSKDPGYYAILLGQIDILGEKVGIAPRENLNELVLKYKPKIISGGVFWDTYEEMRGNKIPAHIIYKDILLKYYDYTSIGDLFILKQEYQKYNCNYNGKSWRYRN